MEFMRIEPSEYRKAGSFDGAFCSRNHGPDGFGAVWCELKDGSLFLPSSCVRSSLMSWKPSPKVVFAGEVEVDERYFGGRCKGQRGRGAAGKGACFWSFEARWAGLHEGHSGRLGR